MTGRDGLGLPHGTLGASVAGGLMAWAAAQRRGDSRLYEWLADREERAHAEPDYSLPWTPKQPGYTGSVERLAAFRTGREVNIPAMALPGWVRDGRKFSVWDRAVVSADGSVRFKVDNGRLWLAQNGM